MTVFLPLNSLPKIVRQNGIGIKQAYKIIYFIKPKHKGGDFVVMRFGDLRCKEVINIKDGTRIGFVDDIEFETCTAKILRIIVYGRARFFGLFGREDDVIIDWCDIEVIGTDTVLVRFDSPLREVKRKLSFLESLMQ